MLYGIDYPRPEGSWGRALTWMSAALAEAEVPEQEARLILGENAARLYDLDLGELEPVVERIGPTIQEVLTKVSEEDVTALLDQATTSSRGAAAAHFTRTNDASSTYSRLGKLVGATTEQR